MRAALTNATSHTRTAAPERSARVTPPAARTLSQKVRASCARLVERCGTMRFSAQVLVLQPEHLIAYAAWNETLFDPDAPTA